MDIFGKSASDWAKEGNFHDILEIIDNPIQDLGIKSPRIQKFRTSSKASSLGQPLHMLMSPTIFIYAFAQNIKILP